MRLLPLRFVLCLAVMATFLRSTAELASTVPAFSFTDEKIDDWHGFKRHNFVVNGQSCWVAEPKAPLAGNPWAWMMEFPDAYPERCCQLALLDKGFYLTYMNVGNTFGCPDAVQHLQKFYEAMVAKGMMPKVVLIGISRGGLYAYHFATLNPDKVSVIYGDAPVCDIKSWPGGKGKGKGGPDDWKALIASYHFKDEAEALAYKQNPIEVLEPLAKAKIPLVHVVGDADDVVPVDENTAVLEKNYLALGGEIKVFHKPGCNHHPHGLDDPTPVVDFILGHSLPTME